MLTVINERLFGAEGYRFGFWCPGCKSTHLVDHRWDFDGNFDAPSISPSLRVTSGHFMAAHKPGAPCWCTYNLEHPEEPHPFTCQHCHTFIRGGVIDFLPDCSHALAGQKVPIPPLPEHLRAEK